jgi:hypothetical protein
MTPPLYPRNVFFFLRQLPTMSPVINNYSPKTSWGLHVTSQKIVIESSPLPILPFTFFFLKPHDVQARYYRVHEGC